ncbi:MAG: transglutaminase-like domain-containing protein [Pseudomonadales bacterium]|nr:transglutaminase-like domain-containing protein [Pseudomonadales bacterium]
MSLTEITMRARFKAQLKAGDSGIDLIEASLIISAEHNPELDLAACRNEIRELGVRAKTYFGSIANIDEQNVSEIVTHLCTFLKEQEGFCGNSDDYYDPENSYIDRVLQRRSGIPISLAMIYIHVARHLGYAAAGVGFPGHFLVKIGEKIPESSSEPLDEEQVPVIIDPFAGIPLSTDDCRTMLEITSQGSVAFSDELLASSSNRDILQRMLGNLKMIYLQRQDFEEGLRLCDWLLLIAPDSAQNLFDRSLVLEKLKRFAQAADGLEGLLDLLNNQSTGHASTAEISQQAALLRKIQHLRTLEKPSEH